MFDFLGGGMPEMGGFGALTPEQIAAAQGGGGLFGGLGPHPAEQTPPILEGPGGEPMQPNVGPNSLPGASKDTGAGLLGALGQNNAPPQEPAAAPQAPMAPEPPRPPTVAGLFGRSQAQGAPGGSMGGHPHAQMAGPRLPRIEIPRALGGAPSVMGLMGRRGY